jgi:hypothetical protein
MSVRLYDFAAHGFVLKLTELEMNTYKSKWHSFYTGRMEESVHAVFGYVERIIVGTLVVSAGTHISTSEPSIMLFGYLRHGLVGRGIELFGIVLLVLNFLDGLYRLSKSEWHTVLQIIMAVFYVALSVRLVQLILAFRGE